MHKGSLYCVNNQAKSTKHIEQINLSNGIAWSNDGQTMYYIDSPTCKVDSFKFNLENGTISKLKKNIIRPFLTILLSLGDRKLVFDLAANGLDKHYPDGMTIDLNGNLWVACYNGGKVNGKC